MQYWSLTMRSWFLYEHRASFHKCVRKSAVISRTLWPWPGHKSSKNIPNIFLIWVFVNKCILKQVIGSGRFSSLILIKNVSFGKKVFFSIFFQQNSTGFFKVIIGRFLVCLCSCAKPFQKSHNNSAAEIGRQNETASWACNDTWLERGRSYRKLVHYSSLCTHEVFAGQFFTEPGHQCCFFLLIETRSWKLPREFSSVCSTTPPPKL